MTTTLALLATVPPLKGLLIGFIIIVIVIALIGGVVWCIEQWINPIPPPVKLIVALILVALLLIWAVENFAT